MPLDTRAKETAMEAENEDEAAIRKLIADWSAAATRRDYAGVLRHHSQDLLMFDVPPLFQSEGIEAYNQTWYLFFGWMAGPPKFEFSDVRVTAEQDVAFATARGKCFAPDEQGRPLELEFRLTMGLRKERGQRVVMHEHHSVPSA